MLKAVIFDFDGVIADSESLHYKAINQVVAGFGVEIPKELSEEQIEAIKKLQDSGL